MTNLLNTILNGDIIDNLKKIPDESVDMIFADPPYFMQTDGDLFRTNGEKFDGVSDKWDKFSNYFEYDEFCAKWLTECKRVLKKNASIWVIGSFQNIYRIGYLMQNLGYWILNDIVWSKPNAVPNFAGTRFQNSHETLLWCTKNKNAKYTFNYKTMKFLNDNKQEKSVWNIGICIGSERLKDSLGKKIHSTQKPEKLLYKIVISSTKPNDIILDPFFGTGTTGAIAKLTGRNYIGIEREEKYIVAAKERIEKVVFKPDEISNLSKEVKPPKISLSALIDKKYLFVEQELYDKNKKLICKIAQNNKVEDSEELLSIHKMSAKYLNQLNHNGWDYFYVYYKNDFVPLNDLRYLYSEEQNNEF